MFQAGRSPRDQGGSSCSSNKAALVNFSCTFHAACHATSLSKEGEGERQAGI